MVQMLLNLRLDLFELLPAHREIRGHAGHARPQRARQRRDAAAARRRTAFRGFCQVVTKRFIQEHGVSFS